MTAPMNAPANKPPKQPVKASRRRQSGSPASDPRYLTVDRIIAMDRSDLAKLWEQVIGKPLPPSISKQLLTQFLCFDIQCKQGGGLDRRTKRQLKLGATNGGSRSVTGVRDSALGQAIVGAPGGAPSRTLTSKSNEPSGRANRTSRTSSSGLSNRLKPGAHFLREWQGKTHRVDVLDQGFVYQERQYNSLSAIAKEITGAHWSGPRFFGLNKQPAARRGASDKETKVAAPITKGMNDTRLAMRLKPHQKPHQRPAPQEPPSLASCEPKGGAVQS